MYLHDRNQPGSPTAPNRSPKTISQTLRQHIQDASVEQARLARSRDQLLRKRAQVQTLKNDVEMMRMEAGDAEAMFMSHVRSSVNQVPEHSISQNGVLAMVELFNNVESKRNKLGVLETDLQQEERALAGAELRFGEEERMFYQFDLFELFQHDLESLNQLNIPGAFTSGSEPFIPPPPPPPPPGYIPPVHLDSQDYPVAPPPPPPMPVPSSQTVFEPSPRAAVSASLPSRLPLLSLVTPGPNEQEDHISKFELDGLGEQFENNPRKTRPPGIEQNALDLGVELSTPKPIMKDRVCAWLFTLLENNVIEQALYQNILKHTLEEYGYDYLKEGSWEGAAAHYRVEDNGSTIDPGFQDKSRSESFSTRSATSTTRTNPALRTSPPKAIYVDISSDPINFPLQQSPLSEAMGSYLEDEDDDPSYFPLPPSPMSQASEADNNDVEVANFRLYVPLPPTPVWISSEPQGSVQEGHRDTDALVATATPIATTPKIAIVTSQDDAPLPTSKSISEPIPQSLQFLSSSTTTSLQPRNNTDATCSRPRSGSLWTMPSPGLPRLRGGRSKSASAVLRPAESMCSMG